MDIYKNAEGRVKIDKEGPNFKIDRGVKQGDPYPLTCLIAFWKKSFGN